MKSIKLVCLFLALMLSVIGCRKKTAATKTRKDLTESKILLHAAWVGDIERIQSLVSRGADVDAKDKDGDTPLHSAVSFDYYDVVELLIEEGANVNTKNQKGKTPLSLAKDKGSEEIVELLRKHGAKE